MHNQSSDTVSTGAHAVHMSCCFGKGTAGKQAVWKGRVTAVNISPAVIRLYSQSLTGTGNVLLQRGAADHPTNTPLLEVWPSFWQTLTEVHLMKLQDACR